MRVYYFVFVLITFTFSASFLNGCTYPNLADRLNEDDNGNEEPNSEDGGRGESRGGGRGGGSSGNSPEINIINQINRVGSDLNVDDYLDSAVAIYLLFAICADKSSEPDHQACTLSCSTRECIKSCDRSHECTSSSGRGSGVFESSTTVLTNYHVVGVPAGFYHIGTSIENYSGNQTLVKKMKWYHKTDDVALVELTSSIAGSDPASFGNLNSLNPLDELFTIGNPGGIKWVASLGYLTKKHPTANDCGRWTNCILYAMPTGAGNSGGPIFDSGGKLVGLHAFTKINPRTHSSYDHLKGGPHIDRIKVLMEDKPNAPQAESISEALQISSERSFQRIFGQKKLSRKKTGKVARNIKHTVLDLSEDH